MKLNKLIDVDSDIEIDYISENTNDIKANTLFFALRGEHFDSHRALDEVIAKGAKAIVHTQFITKKQEGIIYYQVEDINETMAMVASIFFDRPSSMMNLIGVTGTNGKSTITWLLYQLLDRLDSCGYIGTIAIEYGDKVIKNHYTTPKSIELNYHLRKMVDAKIRNCAMEVSSHALTLKRAKFLNFKYAIMTNLTYEHINFHGSMEAYLEAKKALFEDISSNSYAILNVDDEISYKNYLGITKAYVITYGIENQADVMAKKIKLHENGLEFILDLRGKEYQVSSNLIAKFNVYNLLAVLAVLEQMGYQLNKVIPMLADLDKPEGRMENIILGQDFQVIVDFAHTPDGMEQVLQYAQTLAQKNNGRIISVFGSAGGDRDASKRPDFGKIASQYANKIILTQDDNRTESVTDIANDIKKGITIDDVTIIEDRSEAIAKALEVAQPHDVVLILGKANDKYQYVGSEQVPYEGDKDVVTRLIKERLNNNNERK